VNAIAPGTISMTAIRQEGSRIVKLAPLAGKRAKHSDIADAVIYLDAAEFLTGQPLVVDGGRVDRLEHSSAGLTGISHRACEIYMNRFCKDLANGYAIRAARPGRENANQVYQNRSVIECEISTVNLSSPVAVFQ